MTSATLCGLLLALGIAGLVAATPQAGAGNDPSVPVAASSQTRAALAFPIQ